MADLARPEYGTPWASEGEIVAPAQSKVELGWVQEMMPFQWENYLQNRQDSAITYLLQKGVSEYSATQEYIAQKSVVVYQGAVFIATQTVTGVLPTVTSSWKRLSTISDASGVVSITGGGTGATTASGARTNLGLGSAALLDAGAVVQKDTNGDFSANVITATLAGNATTADKLKTARTVQITGAAISTATPFDGSANLAVPVTVLDANALTVGTVPVSVLGNAVTRTSSTGAANIPVGTTAERPSSPLFGHFRGNTGTGLLEYYSGSEWVSPTAQSLSYVLNRGNHTGTQPISTVSGLQTVLDSKADNTAVEQAIAMAVTFATVPTTFQAWVIVVTQPHLRCMVWNGTKYVRAPWHQPGTLRHVYRDLRPGELEVRGDVVLQSADFPDLAEYLGVTGSTFVLDEARGEFLRALSSDRAGVDVGRTVGSSQAATHIPSVGFYKSTAGDLYLMGPNVSTLAGDSSSEVTNSDSTSGTPASGPYIGTTSLSAVGVGNFPRWHAVRPSNIAYRLAVTY